MTSFSPDQIDDLKPLARRYDLALEDDFVVSVLPNGIKTWVYVYVQDGRMQRRTLGVYPDMGVDAARLSLEAARTTRRSLQDAMERSARAAAARAEPRHAAPAAAPKARPLALVATLAAGIVLAAGMWLGLRVGGPAGDAGADQPAAAAPTSAADDSSLVAAQAPDDPAPAGTAAGSAADAGDSRTVPGVQGPSAGASPGADLVAPASAAVPVSDGAPEEPSAAETPAPGRMEEPTSSIARADPGPRQDSASPAPAGAGPGVIKHDPRVARAVLTDKVVRREPVGSVGPEVQGGPGGVQQLFFFTELRGFAGEHLRYRWEREGRLEAETPMHVGTGWRWRNYSRKDLLPTQTGEWQVQLLDEANRVLAETRFVYRNDAPGAQSAEAN
jgi:hypothetical protein